MNPNQFQINEIAAGPKKPLYKGYRALNQIWKASKTAWNPTVHVNNMVSNLVLLDLVDGDIARNKGLTSNFGHWLDIFFDKFVEVLLIAAFVYASFQKSDNVLSLLLGGGIITFHLLIQYLMKLENYYTRHPLSQDLLI